MDALKLQSQRSELSSAAGEGGEAVLLLPRVYGCGSLGSYQELLYAVLLEYLVNDFHAARRAAGPGPGAGAGAGGVVAGDGAGTGVIQYHEWEAEDLQRLVQLLEGWLAIHHAPTSPRLLGELQLHLLSHKLSHPTVPGAALVSPTALMAQQQETHHLLRSNVLRYVYYHSLDLGAWMQVFRSHTVDTPRTAPTPGEGGAGPREALVRAPCLLFPLEDLREYAQLIHGHSSPSSKGEWVHHKLCSDGVSYVLCCRAVCAMPGVMVPTSAVHN